MLRKHGHVHHLESEKRAERRTILDTENIAPYSQNYGNVWFSDSPHEHRGQHQHHRGHMEGQSWQVQLSECRVERVEDERAEQQTASFQHRQAGKHFSCKRKQGQNKLNYS